MLPPDLERDALRGRPEAQLLLDGADRGPRALRRAAAIGWAFFFGQFLIGLHWIVYPFMVDPDNHLWQMPLAIFLPAGLGQQAGAALFGAGSKPEIQLHYDPSQSSALAVVRGMLAQTLMQEVSRSTFSADSPVLGNMKREVEAAQGMDPERRSELVRMFDSISAVQRHESASAASAGSHRDKKPRHAWRNLQ